MTANFYSPVNQSSHTPNFNSIQMDEINGEKKNSQSEYEGVN